MHQLPFTNIYIIENPVARLYLREITATGLDLWDLGYTKNITALSPDEADLKSWIFQLPTALIT